MSEMEQSVEKDAGSACRHEWFFDGEDATGVCVTCGETDEGDGWITAELTDASVRWDKQDDATKPYVNADYWSNPTRPLPPGSGADQ